jgi:Fe-S cluster assembly protein SufD
MADVKVMKTIAEQQLAAEWQEVRGRLPGSAALREAAFQQFDAQGLPHRRIEEWKYTDLRALMRDAKPLASAPSAAALARAKEAGRLLADAEVECRRLTFVDGTFVPELSDLTALEPGLTIRPMAKALADADPLIATHLGKVVPTADVIVALNTAFMGDGAVIHVGAGASLDRPLHLVFACTGEEPASVFARSLVVVERDARAMLVETHEGNPEREYQMNTALELRVGERSYVDHVKITQEGERALHLSTLMAGVGAGARFNTFLFTVGGAVVRNQLFVTFNGADTVAGIRGACLLSGRQHVDTTLVADHAAGGCQSREMFKSVLDGQSRSVFQGKIIVRPHAQKTDAKMATHALMLSETAEANNKPELEIFADDVQCGHGATVGALDEELLFYLRARGIPPKEAEALLVHAFVGEAVEGIEHAGLREALMDAVASWLQARQ